eukprot:15471626-Alexandrium_andersonii.AAC.1
MPRRVHSRGLAVQLPLPLAMQSVLVHTPTAHSPYWISVLLIMHGSLHLGFAVTMGHGRLGGSADMRSWCRHRLSPAAWVLAG